MQRFYVISCHVLWRELCHYAALSRNVFDFRFLRQGLHDTPDILREELQAAIDAVPGEYDAVLVGYGLCSNGLAGIVARGTRLVVMRGHDCITFLLGSKERYREYFEGYPGRYWYSPGWIDTCEMPGKERYERELREYVATYGKENAEYLMKTTQEWVANYSRAAYVDLGVGDANHYKEHTRRAADWLSWAYEEVRGDSRLIVDFLEGKWNENDFLVVEPGEMIIPSHDEGIVAKRKSNSGDDAASSSMEPTG